MEGFQCHHHMKEVCQMQAWGSEAATLPHPSPYMFLTKFSWCSIQQMQKEGTANIGYKISRLHHWSNLEEDRCNHKTSKDTTRRTININHRKKEEGGREEKNNATKFGFLLFFFFIFSFCATLYMCSIFCFYLFSACVIIVELV
jgi:hypothetical protein